MVVGEGGGGEEEWERTGCADHHHGGDVTPHAAPLFTDAFLRTAHVAQGQHTPPAAPGEPLTHTRPQARPNLYRWRSAPNVCQLASLQDSG